MQIEIVSPIILFSSTKGSIAVDFAYMSFYGKQNGTLESLIRKSKVPDEELVADLLRKVYELYKRENNDQ